MSLRSRLKAAISAGALALAMMAAAGKPATAQGVPVYDASNYLQLVETIANQLQQIEMLQAQIMAMTGPRGYGLFLNSAADIAQRAGVSEGLDGVMDYARTGAAITGNVGRITASIDRITGDMEMGYLGDFAASDYALDRALSTLGSSGLTAMAVGEDAYARSDQIMAQVNAFTPEIENAGDLQAAIALNTRVNVANLQAQAEILRLLAAQTNAHGARDATNARDIMTQRLFMQANEDG